MLYNQTSECSIVKYSINFPKVVWERLNSICGRNTCYGGHKATYIRELVEKDLEFRDRQYQDPSRKYPGVNERKESNSFIGNFFKKSA